MAASISASRLKRICARSSGKTPCLAVLSAAAAVVHCSKRRRLTKVRQSARTIASSAKCASRNSITNCQIKPNATRPRSASAKRKKWRIAISSREGAKAATAPTIGPAQNAAATNAKQASGFAPPHKASKISRKLAGAMSERRKLSSSFHKSIARKL